PGGGWALFRGSVAAGGEEPTVCRGEHAADGLDPELITMHVDEGDHFVVGRSSSAAKKAEVNSTRQRNTIDDHLGAVVWRRSGDRVCRRIDGNRYGSCGRRERRSARSLGRWDPRQDRSSR